MDRSISNKFISEINQVNAPAKKPSSSLSGLSFLDAMKSVAQAKAPQTSFQVNALNLGAITVKPSFKKEVKLTVQNLVQRTNECGPTSLAMIEKYYGIDPGNYHNMFDSDTVGHSPLALKEKAVAKGMTVRQENYGTLEDLAAMVDTGIPPMVLGIYGGGINLTPSDYIGNAPKAHWMVVTGYKTDDAGKISNIYFNNPNSSLPQCWTASDFISKFWDNNIIPGGHRYYMAMTPNNDPKWGFNNAALKRYLPQDKISDTFKSMLQTIHALEGSFYSAEKAANTVADKAEDLWSEISGLFS